VAVAGTIAMSPGHMRACQPDTRRCKRPHQFR